MRTRMISGVQACMRKTEPELMVASQPDGIALMSVMLGCADMISPREVLPGRFVWA